MALVPPAAARAAGVHTTSTSICAPNRPRPGPAWLRHLAPRAPAPHPTGRRSGRPGIEFADLVQSAARVPHLENRIPSEDRPGDDAVGRDEGDGAAVDTRDAAVPGERRRRAPLDVAEAGVQPPVGKQPEIEIGGAVPRRAGIERRRDERDEPRATGLGPAHVRTVARDRPCRPRRVGEEGPAPLRWASASPPSISQGHKDAARQRSGGPAAREKALKLMTVEIRKDEPDLRRCMHGSGQYRARRHAVESALSEAFLWDRRGKAVWRRCTDYGTACRQMCNDGGPTSVGLPARADGWCYP